MGKRSCVAVGVAILALALAAVTASVPASAAVTVSVTGKWQTTMVSRLADKDARPEVRVAARLALLSKDVEAAVARFLAPGGGYETAKARSAQNVARNADVIRRVLATTSPLTAPAVYAAATRASHGTCDEQDEFVRAGWDRAREQDERGDNQKDKEVARQAQADRDFVAGLAEHDPGPWVRAAAVRTGSDADLVEFFGYEWASAARCDEQAYRVRMADQDLLWRSRLDQLVASAEEAEAAVARAEAAVVEKARAAAAQAWRTVAEHAGTVAQSWDTERSRTAEQIKAWTAVAEFAKTATTAQDWKTVSDRAGDNGGAWAEEQAWARTQAAQWLQVAESARANESRVATR
ncbi:hypothetical protein [Amycolatopsis sp. lyj-108]|uniref:hypothetical protein n=1 Tax=Amycolatopsis sp. lyj-108 TaxID=2789286 RepID=UPI00397E5DEA